MPAPVLAALACPHCGAGLAPAGDALGCAGGHAFDVARQGYASLLTGQRRPAAPGDDATMVHDREEFLEAGHFAPLARRITEVVAGLAPDPGMVADVGAGTGYYLRHVLDALPGVHGLALDTSVYALRRASRAHPRAGAASCDAWRVLPLRTGAVGVLLNVFAPRNGPEFRRVLADSGALVVVAPTGRHLAELREPLGLIRVAPDKEDRVARRLATGFAVEGREEVTASLRLDRAGVRTIVGMGPSARHADPAVLRRRISALAETVEVTASWTLSVYRPT
ncbi:methyltransferase type 11 [Halostreptopolyspora alba]|uniref:Methyltransferase type 11 n=2 Tax=Halostreptopolyspora alba TaxID=2487137 RepID=A0A3N0EGL0_9ACTN|nr:methyltransferase type 11 [Nocardiopsaceae bacterium YIM 96095]